MKHKNKHLEYSTPSVTADALKSYIEYYTNLEQPGFALLVTGEWGSGKTFQVQRLIAEKERIYVSLFGLTNREDILGELLGQIYPADLKAKKEAKYLEKLSLPSLPIGQLLASFVRGSLKTKVKNNRIIVFDDIERAEMPLKVFLGIINDLVEHEKCHVVVIAHDNKIAEEFSGAKEKVFGHTITVRPHTDEAFEVFASKLTKRTQRVLSDHRSTLLDIFLLSGCQSLRVLRQAMMGIERFLGLLEHKQIAEDRLLKRLLSLYFAISVEVLRGQIGRNELADRTNSYALALAMRQNRNTFNRDSSAKEEPAPFAVSHKRYLSMVDISNFDISNELVVEMIIEGRYEKEKLQSYFEETQLFEPKRNWPAWRRFMSFDELPDVDVAAAAEEMDRQFANREVTDLGEWMHIVSLRLMRIDEGLMKGDREEVLAESQKYLDDLVQQKKFPLTVDSSIFGPHPAHGGMMFWGYEKNADQIKKIFEHALYCEKLALESLAPQICKRIFAALMKSPDDLASLLNYSENSNAEYQSIPVMTCLPVKEFVDALLRLPLELWRPIQMVLIKRREMSSVRNSLAVESGWFEELESEMVGRSIEQQGTLSGLRIKRHIPRKH